MHQVHLVPSIFMRTLHISVWPSRDVSDLRYLRIGAHGTRPAAFNTVRYSEKLLEQSGISIETLDLFELFGWVGRLKDNDATVNAKLGQIQNYAVAKSIPPSALLKMAKFGVAVDKWMRSEERRVGKECR